MFFRSKPSVMWYRKHIRIGSVTKCYISIQIAGANSSPAYSDVLDMCSNISGISHSSYLTSPGFPAGFHGTGFCICTMKPVKEKWVRASIQVEHIMLSDLETCNEVFSISISTGRQQKVVHECSPTQFGPRRFLVRAREIRVSFRRVFPNNAMEKSVLWLGFFGKFAIFSQWCQNN